MCRGEEVLAVSHRMVDRPQAEGGIRAKTQRRQAANPHGILENPAFQADGVAGAKALRHGSACCVQEPARTPCGWRRVSEGGVEGSEARDQSHGALMPREHLALMLSHVGTIAGF